MSQEVLQAPAKVRNDHPKVSPKDNSRRLHLKLRLNPIYYEYDD